MTAQAAAILACEIWGHGPSARMWGQRARDGNLPVGSKGKAPVKVWDEVLHKLKINVKLLFRF